MWMKKWTSTEKFFSTHIILQDIPLTSVPQTDILSTGVHAIWLTFEDQELERKFEKLRSASFEIRSRSVQFLVVWFILALYHELPWGVEGLSNWIVGIVATLLPALAVAAGIALSYSAALLQRWGGHSVLCSTFITLTAVLASAVWKFLHHPPSQQCPANGANCPSFVINQANVGVFSLLAIWANLMSHLLFRARLAVTAAVFAAFLLIELATSHATSAAYYFGIMAAVAVSDAFRGERGCRRGERCFSRRARMPSR
jgi:hypothetical protein